MTIPEADARRFRILQILEVDPGERIASGHLLDFLRGQHFSVAHEPFQEDLAWLEQRGFVTTGPLDAEVWVSLTGAGRDVIELCAARSPAPDEHLGPRTDCRRARLSETLGPVGRYFAAGTGLEPRHTVDLGHGAWLTVVRPDLSMATLQILEEAARALVRSLLDNPKAVLDQGTTAANRHLGAREAS